MRPPGSSRAWAAVALGVAALAACQPQKPTPEASTLKAPTQGLSHAALGEAQGEAAPKVFYLDDAAERPAASWKRQWAAKLRASPKRKDKPPEEFAAQSQNPAMKGKP